MRLPTLGSSGGRLPVLRPGSGLFGPSIVVPAGSASLTCAILRKNESSSREDVAARAFLSVGSLTKITPLASAWYRNNPGQAMDESAIESLHESGQYNEAATRLLASYGREI